MRSPHFPLISFYFHKSEHFRGKQEVIPPPHTGHCWKDGFTYGGHSGSSILSMVEGEFCSFLFAFRGLYIIMTFFSKQNLLLFLSIPPPTFPPSSPFPVVGFPLSCDSNLCAVLTPSQKLLSPIQFHSLYLPSHPLIYKHANIKSYDMHMRENMRFLSF